jgi:hypothetical protein
MAEGMTPGIHHIAACLLMVLGHLAIWVGAFSRLHSLGIRCCWLRLLELQIVLALLGLPAAVLLRLAWDPPFPFGFAQLMPGGAAGGGYFWLCTGWGAATVLNWSWRKWKGPPPEFVRCERQVTPVAPILGRLPCGDGVTRMLARLPGNQIFELETNVKTLLVPRLPACLDGLTVVHLSDLHFTGCLTQDFFHLVIDQVNELDGDLVALTGDVIDVPPCVSWISEILGRVRSRLGAFCVFGNHDLRIRDMPLLVREVERAGWHYLGGRWRELRVRNHSIVLAGNELPWLGPPADMATWPRPADNRRPLRILLSHSPDQIQWARARDFDLMLAGHTHGGQIQLPVIGPLIGQSRYGVRYCCGVFHVPPTLLHVSRGVSGVQNLRLNCRPELTKLVLRCGAPLTIEVPEPSVAELLPGVPVPAAVSRSRGRLTEC